MRLRDFTLEGVREGGKERRKDVRKEGERDKRKERGKEGGGRRKVVQYVVQGCRLSGNSCNQSIMLISGNGAIERNHARLD